MNWIRSLTQTKQAFLLSVYIGLILNLIILYRRFEGQHLVISLPQSLVISIEIIICVSFSFFLLRLFSIFGKLLYRLIATFISLVSVVSSYYIATFHVVISYGIVASVMTTQDMDLFAEVIGIKFVIWSVVGSIIPILLIWLPKIDGTLNQQLCHWRSAIKGILSIVLSGLLVWLPLKQLDRIQNVNQRLYSIDMPSYSGTVAHSYLPVNWLAGLGLYAYTLLGSSQNYQDLPNPSDKYSFLPTENLDDTYVIFIIGETTRGDHTSLLGYGRETTPLLEKEPNLVAFQGRSCDTATKLSLRCMFVKEGDVEDDQTRTLKAKNVFSVLKKLGFSSELFALQGEVWFYSMLDANNYEFREMISSEEKNIGKQIDDIVLVDKVDQSLNRYPKGKHLIVLHTKGSHYLYTMRYPREFAKYQPECFSVDSFCSEQQYMNSYDNSVLYVDYFIKNVIDQVRDKKAIVIYASDHGESMSDGMHLHGTPRDIAPPEQFNIPILVWMSDTFIKSGNNQLLFENLKQNGAKQQVHRHEEIFDSILGCLGYTSPNGGIDNNNNWCSVANSQ